MRNAVQSHENAPGQAKRLKVKSSRENRMIVEPHRIELDEALYFPEELVEKILAKMPPSSLFKTRLLSKAWSTKLPSSSMKSSLAPFQQEVISVSRNWITYCPVFYTNEGFWGFDRILYEWKYMFSLSHTHWEGRSSITSVGPLMLVVSRSRCFNKEFHGWVLYTTLLITNVVTRSWKKIIMPMNGDDVSDNYSQLPGFARLLPGDFDTYRVVIVYQVEYDPPASNFRKKVKTLLYTSSVNEWSVTYSEDLGIQSPRGDFSSSSAYLDGKLYCIFKEPRCNQWVTWKLCIYHVDSDKIWRAVPLDFSSMSSRIAAAGVVLCGKKIIVVTWRKDLHHEDNKEIAVLSGESFYFIPVIHIYEFDQDSSQLVNEIEGPPQMPVSGVGTHREQIRFTSDDDSIYVHHTIPGIPVTTVVYNVDSGEWGCLPQNCSKFGSMDSDRVLMLGSAFVPSMNPFVNV